MIIKSDADLDSERVLTAVKELEHILFMNLKQCDAFQSAEYSSIKSEPEKHVQLNADIGTRINFENLPFLISQ